MSMQKMLYQNKHDVDMKTKNIFINLWWMQFGECNLSKCLLAFIGHCTKKKNCYENKTASTTTTENWINNDDIKWVSTKKKNLEGAAQKKERTVKHITEKCGWINIAKYHKTAQKTFFHVENLIKSQIVWAIPMVITIKMTDSLQPLLINVHRYGVPMGHRFEQFLIPKSKK